MLQCQNISDDCVVIVSFKGCSPRPDATRETLREGVNNAPAFSFQAVFYFEARV